MKKIRIVLIGILLATSFSVLSSSQAQADSCSAEDPCGAWAVIDSTGLVTNVIVCQPSVCGSGTFNGNKVVLQREPDPVTYKAPAGVFNSPPKTENEVDRTVHYSEQTGLFTQKNFITPLNSVSEVDETTTVKATFISTSATFGLESDENGQIKYTPVLDTVTGVVIYVYELNGGSDYLTFTTPQTREQLVLAIKNREILQRRLDRIERLLRGWLYEL